jgi:hypothetical protein
LVVTYHTLLALITADLQRGERVNVLDQEEDDVWECEYNGKIGFVKVG